MHNERIKVNKKIIKMLKEVKINETQVKLIIEIVRIMSVALFISPSSI